MKLLKLLPFLLVIMSSAALASTYKLEVISTADTNYYELAEIKQMFFTELDGQCMVTVHFIGIDTVYGRKLGEEDNITFTDSDQDSIYNMNINVSGEEDDSISVASIESVNFSRIDNVSENDLIIKPMQSYPNPFNDKTTIEFTLEKPDEIEIFIADQNGRMIKSLANRMFGEGSHELDWDGTDESGAIVTSGTYYCIIRSGDTVLMKKIIGIK